MNDKQRTNVKMSSQSFSDFNDDELESQLEALKAAMSSRRSKSPGQTLQQNKGSSQEPGSSTSGMRPDLQATQAGDLSSDGEVTEAECYRVLLGTGTVAHQYWVNNDSIYKSCILNGDLFSINHFHVNYVLYNAVRESNNLKPFKFFVTPEAAEKQLDDATELVDYPSYFDYFATGTFNVLGDLYPYLCPNYVLNQIATAFVVSYPIIGTKFFEYKQSNPNQPEAQHQTAVHLFKAKLENKFTTRSNNLKEAGLWVYGLVKGGNKKKKIKNNPINKDAFKNHKFNYAGFKSHLEKRILNDWEEKKRQLEAEKDQPPKKRGRKKRVVELEDDEVLQ